MTRGTYLLKGACMPTSCPAVARPSARTWRTVAVATLAAALMLPAGTSSAHAPAAAPMVRQLVWSIDGGAATLNSLSSQLRAAGASVVGRLSVADAVVVEVPSTWQPPVGVATAPDRPMNV